MGEKGRFPLEIFKEACPRQHKRQLEYAYVVDVLLLIVLSCQNMFLNISLLFLESTSIYFILFAYISCS